MQNKIMKDSELTVLVNNEIEWRKMLWKKFEAMEKAQAKTDNRVIKLEVKNALYGSALGMAFGMFGSYIFKMM